MTVLIVDDHPSFRASARTLLESEGYQVVGEAENGADAVKAAQELHPDLVLLDVQLPDVDGFKVTLIIAAALCLITAVVSFVLPGRAPPPHNALSSGEERDLEVVMKAELGGTGLIAGVEPLPSAPEEVQP